jgi:hypothetical protein
MSNGTFDFNLFLNESKETLLNPKSYFSTLKTDGGITEPLIKAVIYGAISGALYFIWGIIGFGGAVGGMFGGAVGIMLFIWAIIGAVIGVFIIGIVMLILSSICKGNTDFEANVRVAASLLVIMPVSAILGFTYGINFYFGMVVGVIVKVYMLWLLYHALVETLKGNAETAKIVSYVLIGLIVLFFLLGLRTTNRFSSMNRDATELLKELDKK